MSAQTDLERLLVERGALLDGHFMLSSGRHSGRFIQKFRVLEDPALLEWPARAIARHFEPSEPTIVVGAAVGGILLAYEVARHLRTKAMFTEKVNGIATLRRGFALHPSDRALVVEDVITTGLSVRETLGVVRAAGTQAIGVGAMVIREPIALPVPVYAVLELPLDSYAPDACPHCASGDPLSDPGSRRAG
ncbi:MAG: orotate phosphoribosyltransferase [Candidatus Eremiobacteraeota bacterium]|nr:orotate phosphoribosyltransferase [Candidatus Eremiobacteraeota bacterium]